VYGTENFAVGSEDRREKTRHRESIAATVLGYDLQLTQYDDRGWRATFYTTGMEHSPTSATGTGWERTPWYGVQRAARRGRFTTGQRKWLGGAPLMIPDLEAPHVKCEGSSAGRPRGSFHHQLIH